MKNELKIPGDKPIMAIIYKYRSQKVPGFIDTEETIITETCVTYLYCYPKNDSNVSICPVLLPHIIFRYLIACNKIDNPNRMWHSNPALYKYRVKQIGYFRLATSVELVMEIADGNMLLCHGISDQSNDNKISII